MTLRERCLAYCAILGVATVAALVYDWVWLAMLNFAACLAFPWVIKHWIRSQ